jgi:hypothetical protein
MTPYYPARDGHPSMFAPEDEAGPVSGEPILCISGMFGSLDDTSDAGRSLDVIRGFVAAQT